MLRAYSWLPLGVTAGVPQWSWLGLVQDKLYKLGYHSVPKILEKFVCDLKKFFKKLGFLHKNVLNYFKITTWKDNHVHNTELIRSGSDIKRQRDQFKYIYVYIWKNSQSLVSHNKDGAKIHNKDGAKKVQTF